MNDIVKYTMDKSIKKLEEIYNYLEENNLLDEQEAIQWLDSINEISIRH